MKNGKFLVGDGTEIDGGRTIVPLIGMRSNGKPVFLGTAFFISPSGAIIVTAKHCLFEKEGKPWKDLAIFQFVEDHTYIVRAIKQVRWNNSDVAILVPQPMKKKGSDTYTRNPIPQLTEKYPQKGAYIASFAYPESTLTILEEKKAKFFINDTWHYGQIEDFHEGGTPMLKNPCFQSSMEIRGGSSGGPVADQTGNIFAINSTGAETTPDIQAYSFLTPINLCFDIEVDLTINGARRLYSIRELIGYKFISVKDVNC
jgi:V8-like Glu-specific endopeptidase